MARLKIGDHVSDLHGSRNGKLVDIEGTSGYVLQDNGVELEFPLEQLKPFEKAKVVEVRTLSGPQRDTTLTLSQRSLLAAVPPSLTEAIAKSYEAGRDATGTRPPFAALPDSKRLEIIRIYLPSLPPRLLAPHMNLVVAMRDLAKPKARGFAP